MLIDNGLWLEPTTSNNFVDNIQYCSIISNDIFFFFSKILLVDLGNLFPIIKSANNSERKIIYEK